MAAADGDDSLYPIAVLIDELRNEDVQVPKGGSRLRPTGSGLSPRAATNQRARDNRGGGLRGDQWVGSVCRSAAAQP
uniref:Uncharacterized protein n=1 Tax=Phasianus colchicus TaxID=9054 RepID=A0A669QZU0_PHACC